VGFSHFTSEGSADATGIIPNPLFFDRFLTVTVSQSNIHRTENGVHLKAVWFIPLSDKLDVAFSAGPSFISVSQELVSGDVVANTQNIAVTTSKESGTAKGVNVGFDGTYLFRPQFGVGLTIQYAGGSVDLPSVSSVKAGGFQIGIGARVRFPKK
jgi:hypothetical protein